MGPWYKKIHVRKSSTFRQLATNQPPDACLYKKLTVALGQCVQKNKIKMSEGEEWPSAHTKPVHPLAKYIKGPWLYPPPPLPKECSSVGRAQAQHRLTSQSRWCPFEIHSSNRLGCILYMYVWCDICGTYKAAAASARAPRLPSPEKIFLWIEIFIFWHLDTVRRQTPQTSNSSNVQLLKRHHDDDTYTNRVDTILVHYHNRLAACTWPWLPQAWVLVRTAWDCLEC